MTARETETKNSHACSLPCKLHPPARGRRAHRRLPCQRLRARSRDHPRIATRRKENQKASQLLSRVARRTPRRSADWWIAGVEAVPAQNRRQRRRLLQQRARLRPRYQWQAAERRVKGCRHGSCPAVANVRSAERVAASSKEKLEPKFAMAAASRRPRCLTAAAALVLMAALRRPLWPAEEMRMATIAPEVTAASQQPLCMPDLLLRLPMK